MSTSETKVDAARLLELLGQQREAYTRLRELSERQRSLIYSDRPEMLLGILRHRQALVDSLARLNEQLAPFRRNWDGTYAQLGPAEREQASALLSDINGLLRVILKTDHEDTALLGARKQTIATELSDVQGVQRANSAYAGTGSRSSSGADVSG